MELWLERFVLAVLAAAVVALGLTNPMKFYLRIVVRDTAGVLFSSVVEAPRRQNQDREHDVQPGIIENTGTIEDVHRFHVRRFSEPYPSRLGGK